MKSHHLVYLLTAALLLFSCVSEDLYEGPDAPGRSTSFDLALNLTAPETKALGDAQTPYVYAHAKELLVSHAEVVIFKLNGDNEPGTLFKRLSVTPGNGLEDITIGSMDIDPVQNNGNEANVRAYQINDIPAKTGNVRVLVIANSTLDFSTCKTYADYMAKVESTAFPATFNPETLVKVGHVDVSLAATTDQVITVPMTQLAARVDFTIKMDLPVSSTVSFIDHSAEIDVLFDGLGKGGTNINNSKGASVTLKDGTVMHFYEDSHVPPNNKCPNPPAANTYYTNPYTGEQIKVDLNGKIAHAMNVPFDRVTISDRWGLKINKITINNIQIKSDLVLDNPTLWANTQSAVPSSSMANYTFPVPKDTITHEYTLRFYSYEKPLYTAGNIGEAIKIEFDTELIKGKAEKRERFVATAGHGIWVYTDSPKNDRSLIGKPSGGWGEDKNNVTRFTLISIEKEDKLPPEAQPQSVFNKDLGSQSYFKKYIVVINPDKTMEGCRTDGLIHGNLYSINAYLRNVVTNFDLHYQVADWTNVMQTIPDFN